MSDRPDEPHGKIPEAGRTERAPETYAVGGADDVPPPPAPASGDTGREPVGEPAGDAPKPERAEADGVALPAESMSIGRKVGLAIVIVLSVLFGIFAVGNAHRVTFSWVFGISEVHTDAAGEATGGVPLIVLLLVALIIGVVVGAVLEWQLIRSRRQKAAVKRDAKSGKRK